MLQTGLLKDWAQLRIRSFGDKVGSYGVEVNAHDRKAADRSSEGLSEILTDSQSAIALLHGEDLPRRSRHIEIRIAWLREHLRSGRIKLQWISGTDNPAGDWSKFPIIRGPILGFPL